MSVRHLFSSLRVLITLITLIGVMSSAPAWAFPQGTLSVEVAAEDATIIIDGISYEKQTQLTQQMDIGLHSVEVIQRGKKLWKGTVNINEGETTALIADIRPATFPLREPLRRGTGIVKIDFVNPKAQIFLDGVRVGEQQVLIAHVPAGEHKVMVQVDETVIWNGTIHVQEKSMTTVTGSKILKEPAPVFTSWSDRFLKKYFGHIDIGVRWLPNSEFTQFIQATNAQLGSSNEIQTTMRTGAALDIGAFKGILFGAGYHIESAAAESTTTAGNRWRLELRTQEASLLGKAFAYDFDRGSIVIGGGGYYIQATLNSDNLSYSANVLGVGAQTEVYYQITDAVMSSLVIAYRIARIPELMNQNGQRLTNPTTNQTVALDLGGLHIQGQVGVIF